MPLLFEILLLAAADPVAPSGARSITPLQSLIRADDYPLIALQREEEGTVSVRLDVDTKGFVSKCSIAESSGSVSLDEQTCAIFRARARFEPARDRNGKAISETVNQRITWRLGDSVILPDLPRQAWRIRTTLGLAADGLPVTCMSESLGTPEEPGCDLLLASAEALVKQQGIDGVARTVAFHNVTEIYFFPVPPADAPNPKSASKEATAAAIVGELTIGPSGSISDCKTISTDAPMDVDLCQMVQKRSFDPSPGSIPLVGTIRMFVYMRKNEIA